MILNKLFASKKEKKKTPVKKSSTEKISVKEKKGVLVKKSSMEKVSVKEKKESFVKKSSVDSSVKKYRKSVNKKRKTNLRNQKDHTKMLTPSSKGINIYDVLIKPVLSEKASLLSKNNVYCFWVSKTSTKIYIKQAVEHIYNVSVINVNITKIAKKPKRIRVSGRERETTKVGGGKKAFIQLKKGDTIEF